MILKDWNHAHEIKEQIEGKYEVFVHILGKACLITTSNSKLQELNNWDDCLAMLDISPDEVETITGLEWCGRVFDMFFEKIKQLEK